MTAEPKQLPAHPSITHLKNQAKDLKAAVDTGAPDALEVVRTFHPTLAEADAEAEPPIDLGAFTLRDAQATIARQYGFDGWQQLNVTVGERMVDERDLHRWFGAQLNNTMWDRIEDPETGPDTARSERESLLYSAYAAAYHWRQVGTVANHARGEHLIARMAVKLGEAEVALRHARRCLELVEADPDEMADWDLAFAHEALARALAATGDGTAGARHRRQAETLTAALADDGDRELLEAELARPPWFGLDG